MNKVKIGIYGAASISAGKLMDLLLSHPAAKIEWVISETQPGNPVSDIHPQLHYRTDLCFCAYKPQLLDQIDLVFSCKRPTDTFAIIDDVITKGKKLIDLSADYRLKDPAEFKAWYGKEHTHTNLLKTAVYGLPELHRGAISKAVILANPGCYTTAAILACAPVLKADYAKGVTDVIIDAVSGVSGAGRTAKEENMFINVDGNIRTYRVGTHQHTPEIEQELSAATGRGIKILFVPHVGPFYAGILANCYIRLADGEPLPTQNDVLKTLVDFYAGEPFVRVMPPGTYPSILNVVNTNYCDIGCAIDTRTRTIVLFSAIDNLVKGAAGQAVENMNLMFGIGETTGLL